jgi:hypothetical protein
MATIFLASSLFAKADPKLIDQYLEVSGTKEIILALPKQIEKGYIKSIDKNTQNKINIQDSFDSKKTISYVKSQLSLEFNDKLLKEIITYYKSPLGKKFKNSSLVAINKYDTKNNQPSYKRLKIMNTFVERLELSPTAVHLIGELLGSINANLASSDNPQKIIQNAGAKIKSKMLEVSLYAYNDFSDDELKDIIKYYQSVAGKFEQMIVSNIFKEIIMASFLQILQESEPKMANSKI